MDKMPASEPQIPIELQSLQKSILLSKAKRARSASIGEKLMDGPRLFDQARERIKAGIRNQHPDWDAQAVHQAFLSILDRQRQHAEKDIYRPVGILNDDGTVTPVNEDGEPLQ